MIPALSSVFKVLRGTVIAQAIGFLALPVISRLFSPEAFGMLQAMQSVLILLLIAAAFRLDIAIVSVAESALASLIALCLWLCFASSVVVLIGLLILSPWLSALGHDFGGLLYFLPFSLFMASTGQVLSYVALRFKDFDLNANAKIAQSATYAATSMSIGALSPSATGLMAADLLGRTVYAGMSLRQCRKVFPGFRVFSKPVDVRGLWGQYRKLTLFSLPGALINTVGSSYTAVFLLFIFGPREAGQVAMAERVVGLPLGMIAGAVSQVFIANFAEAQREGKGNQRIVFRQLLARQLKMGIVPAALTFALAPTVFPLVLGQEWETAGHCAQALMPLFLVSFVAGPANMTLTITEHQGLQFGWDIGKLAATCATWFFAHWTHMSMIHALWLYGLVSSVCYLIYLWMADFAVNTPNHAH